MTRSLSPGRVSTAPDGTAPSDCVIVYRIGQLGDTLVALPAIRAIRDAFPLHRLVLVTDRHRTRRGWVSSWDVLGPLRWFDDVVFYDPPADWMRSVPTFVRLGRRLRALRPAHVFNLVSRESRPSAMRDAFFFRFIVRPGAYHGAGMLPRRGRRDDGSLPRREPEWRRLAQLTRLRVPETTFRLPLRPEEHLGARQVLPMDDAASDAQWIAIGAGSKMSAKRWPKDRFASFGEALLAQYPKLRLVVVGGAEDVGLGEELCRAWGERAVNAAGRLSVLESAALMSRCLAYVGNDTGTMHLAAMVGTPCVAVFSARENAGSWEPYGGDHIILRRDLSCSGCMLETCDKNNECLTRIETADVVAAAMSLLDGHAGERQVTAPAGRLNGGTGRGLP